ncbi:MAG TPA: ABC transporter substrate-binding protein [Geminicoccaceae bacterium]|jgi:phospholipid transport system substrate-binding protein|nr:ABC transporter substrate-binding protein [Geminicoccaceae bacterium]
MSTSAFDRRVVRLALLAILLLPPAWRPVDAAPSAESARALIEEVSAEVLTILSDQNRADRQKFDALVVLLDEPIDLDLVGRLILGRHWRTADDDQRRQYLELFREYALANLASKLHLYRGQSFEVTGAKVVSDQDALVTSRILSDGEPPLQVDWRLRQQNDGDLVTIDLIVEGVSLIVTLRSEFASVIERLGFDGLLAELRQRIAQTRQA